MRIEQTREQIAALSAFQNHCEIENVILQSCSATKAKAGTILKQPFSAKPAVSNVGAFLHGEHFTVEVSFEYGAWDSSEPPERLFFVTCTFEVTYRIVDGYHPSEDEKTSFAKGTALFNCWPYAREFLRDITARLGQQPPALPLLRITPKSTPPKIEERQEPTLTGSAAEPQPTALPARRSNKRHSGSKEKH